MVRLVKLLHPPFRHSHLIANIGTGKTHTLIEIIRQLTSPPENGANEKQKRILVCGASNLSVDNILERLLALPPPEKGKKTPLTTTRIGHPARVMANQGVLEATLEVKASKTDQVILF
jgi:DNA polymerase alpha-associated DNA helicase A